MWLMASFLVSIYVSIFSWRNSKFKSGFYLAILMAAVSEWTFAGAFEAAATQTSLKIFWSQLSYLGIVFTPLFYLLLALSYSNYEKLITKQNVSIASVIPLLTLIAAITSNHHQWLWLDVSITETGNIGIYKHGFWFLIFTVYSYLMISIGMVLILNAVRQVSSAFRSQILIIVTGAALPLVANVVYVLGENPIPGLDWTPSAFGFSGLLMSVGIFRFNLVNIVPISRNILVETMRDGVLLINTNEHVLDINPSMASILKLSPKQVIGKPYSEVLAAWKDVHQWLDENRESSITIINQLDDRGVYYDFQVTRMLDRNGTNIGRLVVCRDNTESKQAELELINAKDLTEESESRFKALHNASFGGIAIHDKGVILECNQGLSEISGYSAKELIGMDGLLLIAPDSREMVKSNIVGQYEKPYNANGVRKNGQEYPLRLEGRRIPYKGQEVRVVEFRDISKQKEAEARQKSLEAQLRQSQKLEAVGTMVGGISHELNNILQGMFLYSGLIEEQLPDDEKLKGNFNQLQAGAEKARDIVQQILTFSRKSKIDFKPQVIHDIILEVLSLERASLPANIELKQDIDMGCGPILCDKTQINQIVINLCNNAQHSMEKTGGTLTVSLQPTQASLGEKKPGTEAIKLTVSDTGHGIDPPDLEKIFDPFFTTKQFGRGTGLGLSVIHGIVEMMGGQISVTSDVTKGTTFNILFPVVDGFEEIHTTQKATAPKDDFNMSILLVDDEISIREVTQTILLRKGFAVQSTSDGQKAFDLFQANPNKYNLIVTDLSMPIMSGIELCQAIRASGSDIPIMLSTGHLDIEDQKEYESVGITKSIQKPWTAEELISSIQEIKNE